MSNEQLSLADALRLAQQIHHRGEFEDAEMVYRRILEVEPECADAMNFLGVLLFQRGDAGQAEILLRRAVELQPREAGLYNNLANILRANGDLNAATDAYAKAAVLAPNDAEVCKNYALALQAQSRTNEAIEQFRQTISLNPNALDAYDRTGRLLYAEGRSEEAVEVFRRWLKQEPENAIAQHMLAACSGHDVPPRASDEYVQQMFDGFSESFDRVLDRLRYIAPELVVDALSQEIAGNEPLDEVLDAGCGTGLCGPFVRPLALRLVGVDLSEGMLEKARSRVVYDELYRVEICEHLRKHVNRYDAVLSADTLIYFGDLELLMTATAASLREGGWFVFSIEQQNTKRVSGYCLTPSGRYTHSERYVRDQAEVAGLTTISAVPKIIREEHGKPVGGLIFVCQNTGARINAL